jgi:hypothetical protein
MLNKIVFFLAGLFGVLFLGMGVRWLVDPAGAAASIGMVVLDGLARSSQIGDLAAFFCVIGAFALLGLITRNATFLYAPAGLLGLAAVFRILAWLVQDAALAPQMIVTEIVTCTVFLVARQRMASTDN